MIWSSPWGISLRRVNSEPQVDLSVPGYGVGGKSNNTPKMWESRSAELTQLCFEEQKRSKKKNQEGEAQRHDSLWCCRGQRCQNFLEDASCLFRQACGNSNNGKLLVRFFFQMLCRFLLSANFSFSHAGLSGSFEVLGGSLLPVASVFQIVSGYVLLGFSWSVVCIDCFIESCVCQT